MVINPNESWGHFFKSMILLKEPELVPVSSLPPDSHPKNRKYNSVKYLVNWRGQNYYETWMPIANENQNIERMVEERDGQEKDVEVERLSEMKVISE